MSKVGDYHKTCGKITFRKKKTKLFNECSKNLYHFNFFSIIYFLLRFSFIYSNIFNASRFSYLFYFTVVFPNIFFFIFLKTKETKNTVVKMKHLFRIIRQCACWEDDMFYALMSSFWYSWSFFSVRIHMQQQSVKFFLHWLRPSILSCWSGWIHSWYSCFLPETNTISLNERIIQVCIENSAYNQSVVSVGELIFE